MDDPQGYIYIMTNPSFPTYVKIGYADDVGRRLAQLNQSECTPFAFRVYATYAVRERLQDLTLHRLIDQLNPSLRSIENVNGHIRTREFYAMSAEEAYNILESIAGISGTTDRLCKWEMTVEQQAEEETANEVEEVRRERLTPFSFTLCQIPVGESVEYCNPYSSEDAHNGVLCMVADEKHVTYDGKSYSLSALATMFTNSKWSVAGPRYFKYNGEWLMDVRTRLGG